MNESTEPIIDPEWRALANRAKLEIINDDECDRERLEEYFRDHDTKPFGCYPSPQKNREDLWVCKAHIGRKQRLLGYGTCFQMMRLSDAAVACFAPYRTKSHRASQYNFSQSPAPDIDANAAAIVADMEKLLNQRGSLISAEEREEYRVFRRANRAHKYTQRARVEELLTAISASIDDCNTRLSAIEKQNAAIEKRIGELANRQTVITPPPTSEPGVIWPPLPPVTCASAKPVPANKSPWVDLLTTDKPVVI